ncbi:hypothetical protein DX142_14555 [Listeria monocytogenes]|uniref:hypothetical protein n=1 Tax=Listeria monocytogenes TaxID=1639 RepID=UPI000F29A8CD|nr:hypothetical protein [Listeria monocytogenes]EAE1475538.1 hypothetical protein [Listeria monocytogenes]EAE6915393.1 hypothetical protein [Listeria monocytogenes]EKZ0315079.1 hypothetical protein [Listeria monocytogenes]EKZ0806555.1 hypothetical protein [Listeria monocytogenes]MCV80493.1 hypothetical protein [Listeria monocytogenes]
MGCDIHLMVEVKDRKTNQWTEYDVANGAVKYIGRNYDLFAILANVRNGLGFAGIDTGDAFIPIASPRGVPKDASKNYLSFVEDWGIDGHSHSFLNLSELQNFDWHGQKNKHRGFLSQENYQEYKSTGKMFGCATDVYGFYILKISNKEMDSIIDNKVILDTNFSYYTPIEWEESYYESTIGFVDNVIPSLEKIATDCGYTNEEVRIVFFFDN